MASGSEEVERYIAKAPKEAQGRLREMRAAIREVAPEAKESISYMIPSFDNGRVAWYASMKGYIGLYLRPPIIEEYNRELRGYFTTRSAIHFPLDKALPVRLIKKLVKARIKRNILKG